MTTLALNKKYKGHYEKIAGNLKVTILQNGLTKAWEGTIEEYKGVGVSFDGTKVEMYELVGGTEVVYGNTKSEVSKMLVEYIQKM